MWVRKLFIDGFRGIKESELLFREHSALVGPNGCGKSSVVDALSLVLGRPKMVRPLSEHDFSGSSPAPSDRIRIVATLTGFASNDPNDHAQWFRADRGVPKWIDETGRIHASDGAGRALCVEIGFVARFDHEDLIVEAKRYFHDHDDERDPLDETFPIAEAPGRVLNDLGFFVLPARRGWEGAASFASEFFRRTVSNAAGLPASEVLAQRDQIRAPQQPIEASAALAPLVQAMNDQLARLLLQQPTFKLRLTSGDSDAVLQALLPHYESGGATLPVARHGSGLLSIQALLLLLEVGRARRAKGLNFILALEEPELHLAPGLQGRLVADAISSSDQTLCVTHSPRVAVRYEPTQVYVMRRERDAVSAVAMLEQPLKAAAANHERKLYQQNKARFLEAVMQPYVLVPEGRFDVEWLTRLANCGEALQRSTPFSTVYGLAPTEDAQVEQMATTVRRLRPAVVALVDGDSAGDQYVKALSKMPEPPLAIVQWPKNWTIENVVGWILESPGAAALPAISSALENRFALNSLSDLVSLLKMKSNANGLKDDIVAHDSILGTLTESSLERTALILDALVDAATVFQHPNLVRENGAVPHLRFAPNS